VHVDVEPTQIGRIFAPDYAIVSDAKAALEQFVAVAKDRKTAGTLPDQSQWVQECAERKRTMHRRTDFAEIPIKPQRVYQEMNLAFGPETRYVSTIGLSQIAAAQFLGLPITQARSIADFWERAIAAWTNQYRRS